MHLATLDPAPAAGAGILGGLVTSAVATLARDIGLPLHIERTLGRLLSDSASSSFGWLMGFLAHLGASALLGLVYAIVVDRLPWRSSGKLGLGFGALAGILIAALLRASDKLVGGDAAFLPTVAAFALFGFVLGTVYRKRDKTRDEIWRERWVA